MKLEEIVEWNVNVANLACTFAALLDSMELEGIVEHNVVANNSKACSQQSLSTESDAATSSAVDQSSHDTGASKNEAASVDSTTASSSGEGTEQISGPASHSGTIVTALAQAGNTLSQAQAELVLTPLRLAFETKNGKIMELALDCLHKLIAYDHLEGDLGLDGKKNVTLFTDILNRVCGCVDNLSPDR
ncbi:hypothetical protein BC332_07653 [Capsicum chinense]|nr:hypothetical protein BC332_07653 [Capsicum chinense]